MSAAGLRTVHLGQSNSLLSGVTAVADKKATELLIDTGNAEPTQNVP